ncbi:MAG: type II toxin-antitoxin system ParD family antitoxin, partial [Rubrivivax sp.]
MWVLRDCSRPFADPRSVDLIAHKAAMGSSPPRRFGRHWHTLPILDQVGLLLAILGARNMPTRNVVLSERQQQLVEALVQSGRYQNASEVLREGLRLI